MACKFVAAESPPQTTRIGRSVGTRIESVGSVESISAGNATGHRRMDHVTGRIATRESANVVLVILLKRRFQATRTRAPTRKIAPTSGTTPEQVPGRDA